MRRAVSLAAFALLLALGVEAQAQQLDNPRTDYTAYTRPGGRMAVGPLKIEHGVIDEIMIGTYPAPWLVFPWLKIPVPNTYVKVRSFWDGPLTLAVRGGVAYVGAKAVAELADDEQASGSALSTVGEVDASYLINERFSASFGLDYAYLGAVGSNGGTSSVEGASTSHTYSARLLGEYRFTRVFALTLLLRYLIYQSPLDTEGNLETPSVSVQSDLSAESTMQKRFTALPGVSFVWERWEVSGAVGYGVFYLPILGLASAKSWPAFDLGLAYRFDLY